MTSVFLYQTTVVHMAQDRASDHLMTAIYHSIQICQPHLRPFPHQVVIVVVPKIICAKVCVYLNVRTLVVTICGVDFKPKDGLPNPEGSLYTCLPSQPIILANKGGRGFPC